MYAVDALDGDERRRFEAHLATGCERCAVALRELEEALTRVTLEAPPAAPPPEIRAGLLRRAARGTATRRWLRWSVAAFVAALAGGLLAGAYVAARYEARLGSMARETVAVRERMLAGESALREQVAAYRATAELLRDPATRVVELRGEGAAAAATGRLVWHETAGGRLFVARLPVPPAGQTYVLWTIGAAGPRHAGTFAVDARGAASHSVASAPDVRAFAVSLEPDGGSAKPTGPIALASR